MSRVFICGLGAVSPAGWSVEALRGALQSEAPLPVQVVARPGRAKPLRARVVPPPPARPVFLAHPRLRRTSPITHYAAAAGLEALAPWQALHPGPARIGLICCFQSGCVQYSCRFFEEILRDPLTASPLAFPETVFAAPTSHIATLLHKVELACSLVGDPASFLQGLGLGADWLSQNKVDVSLVVGAEENHWLLADALWHFQHTAIFASGAGAICLGRDPADSIGAEISAITDVHTFSSRANRMRAACEMRAQLPEGAASELLVDGIDGSPRADAPERAAWSKWPGKRLSPKGVLGEGLMAASAWQCVAACDAISRGFAPAATVSLVGCNQQAIGARFAA
jgi:3-oxoacyl-(acyl-carrier-protein) synthase